ncbi:Mediator of RNA polymerase II transcription subunit [Dirofilaria immitis]
MVCLGTVCGIARRLSIMRREKRAADCLDNSADTAGVGSPTSTTSISPALPPTAATLLPPPAAAAVAAAAAAAAAAVATVAVATVAVATVAVAAAALS